MQEETTEEGGVVFWNMEGLRGKDRVFEESRKMGCGG